MSERGARNDAIRIRGMADDQRLVEHMANFVPLGFVPGKDPYANVEEAAKEFLLALADYVAEAPSRRAP